MPDTLHVMATVILVRHGRSTANAAGVLAGCAPGVGLDDHGQEQALATAERLRGVPLVELVVSPLQRCQETARPIADLTGLEPVHDEGLVEVDYGKWQGQAIKDLLDEPLWATVQGHPSAVTFPDGESMAAMAARAAAAVRRRDAAIEAEHGPEAIWVAVSHGDIIKAVLADALGLHLDLFQRLAVAPASLSIIRYGEKRPTVVGMNTKAGNLAWLAGADHAPVVGGGDDPTPGRT
jgi:probable phosphomutase (TIGR03848 family)